MRGSDLTTKAPSAWLVVLLCAAAGGMGWGIRGQYGHETGAMVPGLLVALVVALFLGNGMRSLDAARAAGLTALGIGFGGSMTYAQTVGLTHNPGVIGNLHALAWGMLGLFVKGALWIGLAGAFMGMGFSRCRYRPLEITLLFIGLTALTFLGTFLLNEPFAPAAHRLPPIYFSESWAWEPNNPHLKPRFENWGGLLLALAGLIAYVSAVRKDLLARNLALFGILFGGIGFVAGQSVQAYHAWHQPLFHQGWLGTIEPYMNWWNMMETTFGAVLGAGLGLGAWLNRGRIGPKEEDPAVELTPPVEAGLIAIQFAGLLGAEFLDFAPLEGVGSGVFPIGLVSAIGLVGGRSYPYAMTLPLLALPIAGKTLAQLCYKTHDFPAVWGWLLFVVVPMGLTVAAAWRFERRAERGETGPAYARGALLLSAWLYFWLNFAFFEFPWPWAHPTFRSSNALIFTLCLLALTAAAFRWREAPKPI